MKAAATNPVTGTKMDLSLKGIGSLFVGAIVLLFVFGTSQKLAKKVEDKVNNQYVDLTPSGLQREDVKVVNQKAYVG